MELVTVGDYTRRGWNSGTNERARAQDYARELEAGNILLFDSLPYAMSEEDLAFLLSVKQTDAGYHKNIAYRPAKDRVTGVDRKAAAGEKLHQVMRNYSRSVTEFVFRFLNVYANSYRMDYASFRSVEEKGRDLSRHARNDLLHVDAFSSRASNGDRILRVFSNINPEEPRIWMTSDPFRELAEEWAIPAGLQKIAAEQNSFLRFFSKRSAYDRFMLKFHDYLKENDQFQTNCRKYEFSFPPYSTWMVYTDTVPHSVLSGRFAIEQTYFIRRNGMVTPESAPVNILETLCGQQLV